MIPSDRWLRSNYSSPDFDPMNPKSTNEIIGFDKDILSQSHVSTFIDLRGVHGVYVHIYGFSSYSTLAPGGRRTVVAKVPIDVAYGAMVNYQHSGGGWDFLDVGDQAVRYLKVELRDVRGNLIDLKGSHWSMTLIFGNK
jgi:hypothetical protein